MFSKNLNPVTGQRKGRLSELQQGLSLESATETRAVHIRRAVNWLADGFKESRLIESYNAMFAPRWALDIGIQACEQNLSTRAAWSLICVWLLARSSNDIEDKNSFIDSEEWFIDNCLIPAPRLSSLIASENLAQAKYELLKVPLDQDFWDLFPYLLQESGPGSRTAVLRDPANNETRLARKRCGIFYTPSDVADFMVKNVLSNYTGDITSAKCFDPACGTGVFLLSLCRKIEELLQKKEDFNRFEFVTNNLFGCDISTQAIEACTFVLLHYCLTDIKKFGLSPWLAWHAIRLNLANIDSLLLASPYPDSSLHSDLTLRERQKQMLLRAESWVMPVKELLKDSDEQQFYTLFPDQKMISIDTLFAEAKNGFNILVGNPPYSKIGERSDYALLSHEYHSFATGRVRSQDNIFLPFIEMMWRLTVRGQNTSALVTPLSIAYNRGAKFVGSRKAIQRHGGRWEFLFLIENLMRFSAKRLKHVMRFSFA